MQYFSFNGKLFEAGTPVIGVDNRGLRYGDGLFETVRAVNRRLILAGEHFARLWKGMGLLQFDIPKHFTAHRLEKQIQVLLQKNGHTKNARVRLTVIRSNGGLYDAIDHVPNYIIQSWALADEPQLLNSNGVVMGIYEGAKKACDAFSNTKHNNYLPYAMAALYAKQQKWNDAIVLNTTGSVCDSSIANIFFIKEAKIYTPALSEGCVAGVVREILIDALKENEYEVIETVVSTEALLAADEVFLTNSIYNIRWVKSIGNTEYGNNLIQKIYTSLLPMVS